MNFSFKTKTVNILEPTYAPILLLKMFAKYAQKKNKFFRGRMFMSCNVPYGLCLYIYKYYAYYA